MNAPKPRPKYRSDIDGLRAIAVISVVAYHAFPNWVKGGFIGVDVFFVISGYLISTIIYENLESGTFSFAEFYGRRIRRIFPALILVLIACLALGWFALLADEYKQLGKHAAGGSAFISNFVLWNESGYFDNAADTKPLIHLWSLAVEEQFFIVWPLLLWFGYKRKINFLSIAIVVGLISFYLNIKYVKIDDVADFYSPQTRFWELMAGSILAWVTLYKPSISAMTAAGLVKGFSETKDRAERSNYGAIVANSISVFSIFLLFYGFWRIDKEIGFPGKWAIIPVLGAVLVVFAGSEAWVNRKILSNRVAVWFGLISFPLYLWHWPLLSFARIIKSEVPSRNIRIASVALSIVLAWMTYRFVERPIRWGNYGKAKIIMLIFLMAIVGGFSFCSFREKVVSSGAAKYLKFSRQLDGNIRSGSPEQYKLCADAFPERGFMSSQKERPENFCLLQRKGTPDVILIGDSLNDSLFPGLTKYKDYNVLVLASGAAVPFFNVRTAKVDDPYRLNNWKLTNHALNYAINNRNIRVVVLGTLSARRIVPPESDFRITDILNTENKNAYDIFTTALTATVKRLLDAGKKVIYVLPNPILSYDPRSCLENARPLRLPGKVPKGCSQPARWYFEEQFGNEYKSWVMTVLNKFPQVKVFDAALQFCDSEYCYGSKDGDILYRDKSHLSVSGSNLVAADLHKEIINFLNQ